MGHFYRFKRGDRVTITTGSYRRCTGVIDSAVFQRTTDSDRSTAKLQALALRPSGSGHRTCQRADDLGIAIPSTTERLWPALKFQDFLGEETTTSQLPSGKPRKVLKFLSRKLRTTNAKDEKR